MSKNKRFMVDDAGTLIDIETRECYDIVEEVVDLLNELSDENEQLKSDLQMRIEKTLYWRNKANNTFGDMKTNVELKKENRQLKKEIERLKRVIKK